MELFVAWFLSAVCRVCWSVIIAPVVLCVTVWYPMIVCNLVCVYYKIEHSGKALEQVWGQVCTTVGLGREQKGGGD